MFVYLIQNKINGKKYVGQHVGDNLDVYWDRNVWLAENGYEGKRLLYRAIRKYGRDNFIVRPLVIVGSKEELDYYEKELIKVWNLCDPQKGYNLTQGGGGSWGYCPDEETRAKMSRSRIGKKMSEENRLKFIERIKGNKFALGRKMSPEHFQKIIETHLGAKRTEESRKRMSDAHKGKKWTPLQRLARHNHYHTKRGIVNPQCALCREATNVAVVNQSSIQGNAKQSHSLGTAT